MPSQQFTADGTLAIAGKTNVTGIIDVGSANGNLKVAFTIPNGDLPAFTDGLIHVVVGGAGESCSVKTVVDDGLVVLVDGGTVDLDTFGWSGTPEAAVTTNPSVTLTWDDAATGGVRTNQKLNIGIGIGI